MKKIILPGLILAGFISLWVFSSCEKCDDETAAKAMTTAIIKGYVQANLDTRNDTNEEGQTVIQYENAPEGTVIIARINSAQLTNEPIQGEDLTFNTVVGNNGEYSLSVYAATQNVDVTIMAEDFSHKQVSSDQDEMKNYFLEFDLQTTVVKGITRIRDITYQND